MSPSRTGLSPGWEGVYMYGSNYEYIDKPSVHAMASTKAPETSWYSSGLSKPCGIKNHGNQKTGSYTYFLCKGTLRAIARSNVLDLSRSTPPVS